MTRHYRTEIVLLLFVALTICSNASPKQKLPDYTSIDSDAFFPILPWNSLSKKKPVVVGTNGLRSVAECGFNFAPFVEAGRISECKKLGLGAIVISPELGFSYFKATTGRTISDADIDARVRDMVKAAGKSSTVKGFFLIDEPGVRDFPMLGKAVAALKKHAPGKFAYINLFPDYATIGARDKSQLGTTNYTEYLERFVNEVKPQFVSYDNYMVEMSMDLKDTNRAASYYRNLLEVRRVAQKYNLPFLNIVTANQIRPYTTIPSPANMAFQAYTTLAAGYRGVGWYTYYEVGYHYAPIDKNGERTQTWYSLREVNRQITTLAPVLSRLKSTGVFFTSPTPTEGLPVLPGKVVTQIASSEPMMVGEFVDSNGAEYVMIVNLSLERSAKINVSFAGKGQAIELVSNATGALMEFDQSNGYWLVAGSGVLLKVGR